MTITCLKCGHVWEPRVEKPLYCPICKQAKYWEPRKHGLDDKPKKEEGK